MHHLVHQVCGGRRCTSKVPTRVLYPALPTSHYTPTCPRMGAGVGYCPRSGVFSSGHCNTSLIGEQ